ncbi:MAG: phosphatidate cytidylyltransferase [Terriglobia bacterium]|jgi:phosphatidate cytidylyltransferase|nr:phosphatidate cytidylyltransferase [Terriglobia bacterium]
MKRVLTAVVLIPLVLLALFLAPNWLFAVLVGAVAVLAAVEYLSLAAGYGYEPFRFLTYLLIVTFYGIILWATGSPSPNGEYVLITMVFFFTLSPFVFLCAGMSREDMRSVLPGAAVSYVALPYLGFSLACLVIMRIMLAGWLLVLITFFVIWVGDTAAYYVGRAFGKIKFAPRISPKKTWEGAIASAVASIIVGILLVEFATPISRGLTTIHLLHAPLYFEDTPMWITALVALAINIAGQIGDLLESLIKRGANVKDSGSLLPGHGGILDRIDALLFAAPIALVLFGALREYFLQVP